MKTVKDIIDRLSVSKRIVIVKRNTHSYLVSRGDTIVVVFNGYKKELYEDGLFLNSNIYNYYENEAFEAMVIIIEKHGLENWTLEEVFGND